MEPKIRQAVGDGAIEKNRLTWRLPRFGCQGSAQNLNLKRAIIGAQLRERATVAQLLIDEAASDLSPDFEPKPGQFFERGRLPRARRAGDNVPVQTSATKHTILAIPEGQVVVVCPTVVSSESRRRVLYAIEALMTEKPPRADPLVGLAELAAREAIQ